jgi:hypothetical protein
VGLNASACKVTQSLPRKVTHSARVAGPGLLDHSEPVSGLPLAPPSPPNPPLPTPAAVAPPAANRFLGMHVKSH